MTNVIWKLHGGGKIDVFPWECDAQEITILFCPTSVWKTHENPPFLDIQGHRPLGGLHWLMKASKPEPSRIFQEERRNYRDHTRFMRIYENKMLKQYVKTILFDYK